MWILIVLPFYHGKKYLNMTQDKVTCFLLEWVEWYTYIEFICETHSRSAHFVFRCTFRSTRSSDIILDYSGTMSDNNLKNISFVFLFYSVTILTLLFLPFVFLTYLYTITNTHTEVAEVHDINYNYYESFLFLHHHFLKIWNV